MIHSPWAVVDGYFSTALNVADATTTDALRASLDASLPPINVSANQGKLLEILARSIRATNILEVGTLGGYSTLFLARALPDAGKLITLELDPHHAEIARANFAKANLAHKISLRLGKAADSLAALEHQLAAGAQPPFDLIFIDADKENCDTYFKSALALSHPGTLIIVDNVVRNGSITDPATHDPGVYGIRRMVDLIAKEPRVSATALQTVGAKGYDGIALIFVNS